MKKSLALVLVSAMLLSMMMVGFATTVSATSSDEYVATCSDATTVDGVISEGEYANAAVYQIKSDNLNYIWRYGGTYASDNYMVWDENPNKIGDSTIYIAWSDGKLHVAGYIADKSIAGNGYTGGSNYLGNLDTGGMIGDNVVLLLRTESAATNGINYKDNDPGDYPNGGSGFADMLALEFKPFPGRYASRTNPSQPGPMLVEEWLSRRDLTSMAGVEVAVIGDSDGYTFEYTLPFDVIAGLRTNFTPAEAFGGLDQLADGGKLYFTVLVGDEGGRADGNVYVNATAFDGDVNDVANPARFGITINKGDTLRGVVLENLLNGFKSESKSVEFKLPAKDPTLVGGGTPTIDGALAEGEYDTAGKISLPASNNVYYIWDSANTYYGRAAEWWLEAKPALLGDSEIYINRDANNLYIAGFIADTTVASNAFNDDWYPVGAGSYRTAATGWKASDDFVAVALRTEAAKNGIGANQDPGDEGGHNMIIFTVHPFTRIAKNEGNRNLNNTIAVTENWLTDKRIAATAAAAVVSNGYTFEVAIPMTTVNSLAKYDVKFGGLDQLVNGKLYTSVILGDGIGWAGSIVATGNEFPFLSDLEPGETVNSSDLHWAAAGLGKFGVEDRYVTFKSEAMPAVRENEVPATCTEDAKYEEVVYSNYGEEVSRTVVTVENSALGHDLVHHDAQEATCTEIGWDAYDTCSRCDYTTYAEIDALGHDFTRFVLDGGYAYKACSRCDVVGEIAAPYTGVIKVENDFYYVDAASAILTDTVKNISDAKANGLVDAGSYIIDAEGKIVIADGLVGENFYTNGAKAPSYAGLVSDGTYVYFVDKNAEILRGVDKYVSADKLNGLATTAGWYRIDADGHVLFDTVVDERGYVYVDGVRAAAYAGVVKVGDDFYYVDAEGLVVKGISKYVSRTNDLLTAGYYIIADDGKIQVGNFINDDYVYINGIRITESYYGLVQVGDDYYYVNNNAKIFKNGTKYVNKVNGLNFKRGNYTFDADGKLVIA